MSKLLSFLGGVYRGLGGLARYKLAFYAYNYRANIEIKVSEELYNLLWERYYAIDNSEDKEDREEIGGG
ncbi:hypothetical protein RB213_006580 [Colletotrichum asianum]